MRSLARQTFAVLIVTTIVSVSLLTAPAIAKLWGGAAPEPTPVAKPLMEPKEFEAELLERINKRREKAGLERVRKAHGCLDGISQTWADHLAETREFDHRDQREVLEACRLAWVGENLVRGVELTPRTTVQAWFESAPHRAVMMKPRATRAGIGVRIASDGRVVAVLNLGDI